MQLPISIPEIKQRAERIGLTLGDLAKRASVNRSTAYRAAKGDTKEPRRSTERKLTSALVAAEAVRLAELKKLHKRNGKSAA